MTANPNTKAVVVRMPPELHAAIKATAAAEERSMAATIRTALRAYTSGPDKAVTL